MMTANLVSISRAVTLLLVLGAPAEAALIYSTGSAGSALYTIDTTTGTSTFVGLFGYRDTFGTAFAPDGTLYTVVDSYSAAGRLATVDTSTGAATAIGTGVGVPDLMVLEFNSAGTMYAASWGTGQLYTMNLQTGTPTAVGSLGPAGGIMDLAFAPDGTLYAVQANQLYTIDTGSGAGTLFGTISGLSSCAMGLTFDGSGNLFATDYCSANSPLYQIDLNSKTASIVGFTGISAPHGGDIFVAVAPEPGSLLLLGTGVAGMGLRRWRQRRE